MAAIPAAPTNTPATPFFRNRTFISLWLGHTLSIIGDGFHSVALGFWVLQATGSASAMALIMSTRVVVSILLGAVGGTVVDRSDRRTLMIAMDLIRFLTVGGIALLVRAGETSLLPIIALTALTAVAGNFCNPAFQASLINIVGKEELPKASGLLQVTNTVGQIVGPFLGGAIVALFGGWAALSLDALSFLIAAVAVVVGGAFPSPRQESGERSTFFKDLTAGFQYIRRHPLVSGLAVVAPVINFFGNAIGVLLPVIAVKRWQANSVQLGALEAMIPAGFAIGAMVIMVVAKKIARRGAWMMGGVAAAGALLAIVALMPSASAAMPVTLLCGVAFSLCNVLIQISLQSEIEPEIQGRVFGTLSSLVQVASPLSMIAAGFLADSFSPTIIVAVSGVMLVCVSLGGYLFSPGIRTYN